jgi:hypothetical protein
MLNSPYLVIWRDSQKRVKFGKAQAFRGLSGNVTGIFRISTRFARHSPAESWLAVILTSCPGLRHSAVHLRCWLTGTSSPKTISAWATSTRRSMWFFPWTKIQPGTARSFAGGSTTLPRNVPSAAKAAGLPNSSPKARHSTHRTFIISSDARLAGCVLCSEKQLAL